jgi:hypothetical protein
MWSVLAVWMDGKVGRPLTEPILEPLAMVEARPAPPSFAVGSELLLTPFISALGPQGARPGWHSQGASRDSLSPSSRLASGVG